MSTTIRQLGEVCEVIAGQHIESALYSETEDGHPYLTGPADFGPMRPFVTKWTKHPKVFAACSDVLVTVKGNGVGKINLGCNAAIGRQLMALRPRAHQIDQTYLFHVLLAAQPHLRGLAQGATVPGIGKEDLASLKVFIPTLAEQKRIAGILDAADALRAKRGEAIAELDTLLQATFLDLFGDPRRKGMRGRVPVQAVLLGELVRIRTGKLDANAADADGLYPFFTCAVSTLRINTPAFNTKAVLVAGNGDLNVKYYDGAFNAYQRTYVIESRDEARLHPRFMHIYLDFYVSELRRQAIGGVIKYIKLPYLTEAIVQLPRIEAQGNFAQFVESFEAQRAAHYAHLIELDTLFASLQSRAFRGEL